MKTPPVSYFLKKAANLKSGSKEPGKVKAGTVSRDKVREIATAKMKDLNANDVEAAMIVAGVPAKPLRSRFAPAIAARIEALAWWDWPVEKLARAVPDIQSMRGWRGGRGRR